MPEAAVYVVQHVRCETPGLIAEALQASGITPKYIRLFQGDRIPPRLGSQAGLVVMGGPMGVHEEAQYPFLRQEIRLLEDALNKQRPILGVCLGSQLLAAALGESVVPGNRKEIGWHSVTLSRSAATDALWSGLPESFTAYHWHGDVFSLPRCAVNLAWSAWTECQAFRYGALAYGFLFHLEMTERIIRQMMRVFRGELLESGVSESQVLEGIRQNLPALQQIARRVFQRWTRLVRGETDPVKLPAA